MDRRIKLQVGAEPPAQRLRIWRDLLRNHFLDMECRADAKTLRCDISGRALDQGCLARSAFSPQVLSRTATAIQRDKAETAAVVLVTNGTFAVCQLGHSATLREGDLCLIDCSRPFEAHFAADRVEHGFIYVPKSAITHRVGPLDNVAFRAFRAGMPLQELVSTFSRSIIASIDELDSETLGTLLDQSLDLLALMLGMQDRTSVAPSTHRAGMLLRIKSFVHARLRDDDLTIEGTAAALGMSSRYINSLLASEGTSFGRYVLAQRLEGARRDILDPRRAHAQITEIAISWGFTNPSHFGRVFKQRFGMAPRDARPGDLH